MTNSRFAGHKKQSQFKAKKLDSRLRGNDGLSMDSRLRGNDSVAQELIPVGISHKRSS